VQAEVEWNDYGTRDFRIIGLHSNVILRPGVNPNKEVYIPDDILDTGALLYLMNTQKIERAEGKVHNFRILL
jgi:hypothetical protein